MAVFVCVRRISGLFENNNGVCLCINNQLVIRLKILMYIYSGSGQTHVWNVMKTIQLQSSNHHNATKYLNEQKTAKHKA